MVWIVNDSANIREDHLGIIGTSGDGRHFIHKPYSNKKNNHYYMEIYDYKSTGNSYLGSYKNRIIATKKQTLMFL